MKGEGPSPGILLVANWDSGVGYAWWLMESYWVVLSALYKENHRVHLAYPSISSIPESISSADIELHKIDFVQTGMLSIARQIYFLYRNRIRTIYFSDQLVKHWRYLLFRLAGVKVIVVHDHTPGTRTLPVGIKKYIKTAIMRLPWITVDAVIGATAFVSRRAIDVTRVPKERVYCVSNGIPEYRGDGFADVHEVFGIPRGRSVVVETGRANDYKGVGFALECMAHLLEDPKNESLHYLFCGDGPHLERFQKKAQELGIAGHVTLPGRVENVRALLNSCAFAFHPSRGEVGYSLSIIEYMYAGLPVVVPDNPSVCGATIDKKTGLIYRENDVESASRAIEELMHSEGARREMGEEAKLVALNQYSIDNAHETLRETFELVDSALKYNR